MIAKKPSPDDLAATTSHADETRKVDGMSELVAGMLLDDPDATAPRPASDPNPNPSPSPPGLSAVRPMPLVPRTSSPAILQDEDFPQQRSRAARMAIVIFVMVAAIAIVAVVTAVLFS